jgi:hypothetical protein
MRFWRRNRLLAASALWRSRLRGAEPAGAAEGRLVVVVARASPIDGVTLGLLRRVFLSQPVDEKGLRLVPFNAPPLAPERVLFDRRVLGMSPDEVARHWVDQRIRGEADPPRTIASAKLLKQVVARLPGAISYLSSAELDGTLKPLSVGGYDWTHKDYPLG